MEPEVADDIIGINDPQMTRELLEKLLTQANGPGALVKIPHALLMRVGALCNPLAYRAIPTGELMAIADELNAHINQQVIEAQGGAAPRGAASMS